MERGERERLPNRRPGTETVKLHIPDDGVHGPFTVYLGLNQYPDGRPAEVFMNAAKEGNLIRGLLDDLARVISFALQHGTPPEAIVRALANGRYGASGVIPEAPELGAVTSPLDAVVRLFAQASGLTVPEPVEPVR